MTNDLAILITISTCFNNYNTEKYNAKCCYYYEKYYKSDYDRYRYEVDFFNHYNYSWDDFCNQYNLKKYQINNINEKLYYYLLKKKLLKILLDNICNYYGHTIVLSDNQPPKMYYSDTYMNIHDICYHQDHYDYNCLACNKTFKEKIKLNLDKIIKNQNILFNKDSLKQEYLSCINIDLLKRKTLNEINFYEYSEEYSMTGPSKVRTLENDSFNKLSNIL